jgi:hypothetical protein
VRHQVLEEVRVEVARPGFLVVEEEDLALRHWEPSEEVVAGLQGSLSEAEEVEDLGLMGFDWEEPEELTPSAPLGTGEEPQTEVLHHPLELSAAGAEVGARALD